MEAMNQLQAKLHRAQAEIEESIGHLTKQRAFIANRLADGADVTQSCDLLVISKILILSMFSTATD